MIEFEQILCPVDFSESSIRSLAHAAALAQWYDAQLTVLHVAPTFDAAHVLGDVGVPVRVVNPVTREEVAAEIRRVMDLTHLSPPAVVTVQAGDPSLMIIEHALAPGADVGRTRLRGRSGSRAASRRPGDAAPRRRVAR